MTVPMGSVARRIARLAGALAVAASFTGCVAYKTPVEPPNGGIYAEFKAPLTVDFHGTPCGAELKKASESYTTYVGLWFISSFCSAAWDDVAIAEIAKRHGITEVAYADYELKSYVGVYAEFTINVYGN